MSPAKHNIRCLFLALLFVCVAQTTLAQYLTLSPHQKQAKLRFRMVRNMLVIPVYINNKGPFNFMLDSGVGLMVIVDPKLVDSINVNTSRTIRLMGSGDYEGYEAYATPELQVSVPGGLSDNHISAAIFKKDHFGLSNYAGIPIHGLLGYEFFAHLAVKINFTDSTITAARAGKFKPFKKGVNLAITIEDQKPYFNTKVMLPNGCTVENKFIIDLGAGHPLSLDHMQHQDNGSQRSIIANLGVGLTGPINGYISRVNEVDIGKYKFKNVITSFPDSNLLFHQTIPRDGNLGIGILKKFLIILDYQNGKMYLKPNYRFNEPFEHDMSGIEYYAAGADLKRILISRVEPGSAGDEAGLTENDEITSINFRAVSQMNLVDIDNLFKSKNNRNILVEICRDKKFETVVLTLKRRI